LREADLVEAGRPPEEGRTTVTATTIAATVTAEVTGVVTGTAVETGTATDMGIETVRTIGTTTAIETADGEDEMIEMIEVTVIWALAVVLVTNTIEKRGTMTTSDMTTVIGEMTGTVAVMTESVGLGAMRGIVEAAIMIVGATAIATVTVAATGKPAFKCILMAGISLISSLVEGRFWFKGSETYQSRIRTIRKAVELPMHLNLL